MSLLILSWLLAWLGSRKKSFFWLLLPVGIGLDFWQQRPLGLSGLTILFFSVIFWLLFGQFLEKKGKIKL